MSDAALIVFSLLLSFMMYAIIPIIIAFSISGQTTSKKYRRQCFLWNLIIVALNYTLAFSNGSSARYSFAPYVLWTLVSIAIGNGILSARHKLDEEDDAERVIFFCPNCGSTFSEYSNSRFNHHCKNCNTLLINTEFPLIDWKQLSEENKNQLRNKWKQGDFQQDKEKIAEMVSISQQQIKEAADASKVMYFCPKCYNYKSLDPGSKNDLCPKCAGHMKSTSMGFPLWNGLSEDTQNVVLSMWKQGAFLNALNHARENVKIVLEPSNIDAQSKSSIPESENTIICPNCGKQLHPNYKFCNNCGQAISSVAKVKLSSTPAVEVVNPVTQSVVSDHPHGTESLGDIKGTKLIEDNNLGSPEEKPVIQCLDLSHLTPPLRRAYIFIEDEDWDRANEYLEKVLDEEPENAYAYLGKALIDIKVDSPESISDAEIAQLKDNRNFRRACKYATGELKDVLSQWQH